MCGLSFNKKEKIQRRVEHNTERKKSDEPTTEFYCDDDGVKNNKCGYV